jgi:cyclic beta-1,2-glucan synthetase
VVPAAEWLLDNYHVVEEQIREIRDDLPSSYYRQLPKLIDGPFAGYPRVFGITWAFVAHTDSRFDPEMLCRFVRAYQRVEPLTIGELWAVAITLRIVLVENLRRAAKRIVNSRSARQEADLVADRLLGRERARMRSRLPWSCTQYQRKSLPGSFAVQLVQRLRDQDPKVTPALVWLEERLAAQGTSADEIVHDEHQSQGTTNVTARNVITSMRLISDVDWTELFEKVSLVDDMLRSGSDFASMDFPTRNLYRTAIEQLARGAPVSELEIADRALAAAHAAVAPSRAADPGYHLIAEGRRAFEQAIGFWAPARLRFSRFNVRLGIAGYVGMILLATTALLALALWLFVAPGIGFGLLALCFLIGFVPATEVATALVNRGGQFRVSRATLLPALELREGVPARFRTLVAVPTLLTTVAAVDEQIERLEIHHLASEEGDLHFALVSDWTDAEGETAEGDAALVAAAAAGIARLNLRYGPAPGGARFLLLHRRRVWNESESRWIGWERKRGKLHELNRLLRAATDTTFIDVGAGPARRRPTFAMSSLSTPIRGCRATRCAA